jgi:putative SOS response-associated peptidase YedK
LSGRLKRSHSLALARLAAQELSMCNLYSLVKTRDEVRGLAKALRDKTGNQPPLPGIFPDYQAPIVRIEDGERIIANARWGLPSPPFALQGRNSDPGITNIRNITSKHWTRWLGPENRCLVPFTSFAEPETLPDGKKQNAWFALSDERPIAFFAGVWVPQWKSVRKVKEGETTNDLFAFLTTDPNKEVKAIHPKAMPVILTEPKEWETWLTAERDQALLLQRPLQDHSLAIVARGGRADGEVG